MENINGNVVRDAEIAYRDIGGKQVAVVNFTVAENKNLPGGKTMTRYIKIAVWRKWAESLYPYLKKGKEVTVEGYLESEGWVGNDKKVHSNLIIRTPHSIKLMGKKIETNPDEDVFAGAEA